MKISKLFHWLYALVMLLPIFAIGVTCAYVIFNKNAYISYAEDKVQNVTNINSNNYLMENNTYSINNFLIAPSNIQTPIFTYKSISIDWTSIFNAPNNYNYDAFKFMTSNETSNKHIYLYENGVQVFENHTANIDYFNSRLPFTFVLESYSGGSSNWYNYINTSLISYKNDSLNNVFYYSIDKVQESPLFNWAYDSFLVAPFAYIVALFSMPTNSVVVMLLSYWLTISVIWLTFDLIMYVPLLVHRWLDKGVLE